MLNNIIFLLFCGFRSIPINIVDKLLFIFMFAVSVLFSTLKTMLKANLNPADFLSHILSIFLMCIVTTLVIIYLQKWRSFVFQNDDQLAFCHLEFSQTENLTPCVTLVILQLLSMCLCSVRRR